MTYSRCIECKVDVYQEVEFCPKCGAKLIPKAEYDKLVRSGWKLLGKLFGGIVLAITIWWIWKGDWKTVVVNGQTVTIGDCKNDIQALQRLENSTTLPSRMVPDLVETKVSSNKVGLCGAAALSALESYFYYKDNLINVRTTMARAMTERELDEVTATDKKSLDEAAIKYKVELGKLRSLVK